jgi:uridine kinase
MSDPLLEIPDQFSLMLYEKMQQINAGVADMELGEFRYALENLLPVEGWPSIHLESIQAIENRINDREFYLSIQLKPRRGNKLVMDSQVRLLSQMLFVGLVTGEYRADWINQHFYFDIRGFYFLHRTSYFTPDAIRYLGGKPYCSFKPAWESFAHLQSVGYKAFKEATREVNQRFIEIIQRLVAQNSTPCLIAVAGPTAAGKTEIVARLHDEFKANGMSITSIEMDHFLTDRDIREANGIDSMGKEALHYELLQQSLKQICQGRKISIPRYDFIEATSSHDLQGNLKPGGQSVEIEPADIIFVEGNFPYLLPEIAPLIHIKVLYLTDDEIRLKRKWRRDIDYRKKYELMYFLNRYFREQYLMAEQAYLPQMVLSDLVADTCNGTIWVNQATKERLR